MTEVCSACGSPAGSVWIPMTKDRIKCSHCGKTQIGSPAYWKEQERINDTLPSFTTVPNPFRQMIARENFVILDTETTGLTRPAEICQIAIIDNAGKTLLNTLIKTRNPIPGAATAVHGITNITVGSSPTWPEVRPEALAYLKGKDVIVYNAVYDRAMMHLSDEAWGLDRVDYHKDQTWYCAMEWYAEYYGEWNEYHGSYKWQRLSAALQQQGLTPENAHDALGDCLMTLALIRKIEITG